MGIKEKTMNNIIVTGSTTDLAQQEEISLAQAFVNVDIMIVIDLSGSMDMNDAKDIHGNRATRRRAAETQLQKLQRDHAGKVGVIGFADHAQYLPNGSIEGIDVGGTTDMLKGLQLAETANRAGIPTVLISDGEPNYDVEHECVQLAHSLVSPLHCIYVGPENGSGLQYLQQLATSAVSGSTAQKTSDVGNFLNQVEETLLLG
jgi:Mg-chelatase subunit ChlD